MIFFTKKNFSTSDLTKVRFYLTFVLAASTIVNCFAQEGTRMSNENISGTVMVIPFEPVMYMSQIDKKVNEQTNWNFDQIRENFRRQLDLKIILKLKSKTKAISFYMDSIKMAKDLENIYRSITLAYEMVDPKERAASAKKEKPKNITNGQLTVEINNDNKFMNAKVINPKLLNGLNKKYGAECFIFINELDIKYNMDAYDLASDSYQRDVTVHYTIMDKSQKTISSGIATVKLNSQENSPKKIVEKAFVPIADYIANQCLSYMNPKEASTK